jgi:hypothetical protein
MMMHKKRVLLKMEVERRVRRRNRKKRRTSLRRIRERVKAVLEGHLHQSDKQGEGDQF